jgi:biofilm PGA synthesis protein PgaD
VTPTLVIERPDLQGWRQKYGYAVLTFAFWGLYLYLWQPLLSLVLWSFGVGLAYEEMLNRGGFSGLLGLLGSYVAIIAAFSAMFLGWAWINYLRFRGTDRRRAAPAVNSRDLAEFFDVPLADLIQWRACKSLTIHHDPHGNVVGAEPRQSTFCPSIIEHDEPKCVATQLRGAVNQRLKSVVQ